MKKVLIADDHSIVLHGLKLLVESVVENCTIDVTQSVSGILQKLGENQYDLLISDMNMPESDGLSTIEKILEIQPSLRILIVTVNPEKVFARRYLKSGVFGYVEKSKPDTEIKKAIEQVIAGNHFLSTELLLHLSDSYIKDEATNPFDKLSDREYEIAILLLNGKGTNEISLSLALQNSTVSTHKTRIFTKLGISNLVDLINLADQYHISEATSRNNQA